MLSEVGIMFAAYGAIRVYEKYSSKKNNITLGIESPKSNQSVNSQKKAMVNPLEKQYQYYYKISLISMILSAIRQFFYPEFLLYPILGVLSFSLYIYTTFPFIREVENSLLKEHKINVDFLYLIAKCIILTINQYFAAAFSMWLFFLGRTNLIKAKGYSEKMLFSVFDQQPSKIRVLKNNVEVEIPLESITNNHIIVVNTGEVIPVDGLVVEGIASIDQHALTGESQPIEKAIGDHVFAATIVITGKIYLKVEKSGKDTTIAKIEQILNNSIDAKSNIQLKGEQWANKATLPMLAMSGLIFFTLGPVNTVVFINSHIGYRIRLFAPLGTLNHISLASHKGILIKDGRALESLMSVDTILFDKTGTLTNEKLEIGHIIVCDNYTEQDILTYAAAAEHKFSHPIAKAIVEKAEQMDLMLPDLEDSQYKMGLGITVMIENKVIRVGSARFMENEGITIPESINDKQAHSHNEGFSFVLVAINNQVSGAIELRPQIRPEVHNMINGLRQRGIKQIAIVSGDHKQPTEKLAHKLGMDDYFYDVLPEHKADIVEKLQKQGKSVCFVGDGINDAIAMKKANVSISLRGATMIATDMAEIVLMDGSLSNFCDLIDIAKSLEDNLRKSLIITFIPTILNLCGAFFLHFSIITSFVIITVVNSIGYVNVMQPLKKMQKESYQ